MSARFVLVLLISSSSAWAEGQWLTSRGRLLPQLRLEAWGGARTVGVGAMLANEGRAAWSAEVLYAFTDRVIELRGARVWQLTPTRFATASANLGTSLFVVPNGFDAGVGPNGGVTLGLGGQTVSVDLGLQTGIDVFILGTVRLPQRASIGLTVRVADFTISAMARAGADIVPGHAFVGRGDLMVSVGWLH